MFQKEIITAPKTTWAVWKLSNSVSKDITSQINRGSIKTVVEFWPGWGNITQEILSKLWCDWKLTCFEINEKDFKPYLDNIQDHRLIIHYTSCEDINKYFKENSVDLIISTIPLSLIDNSILNNIFNRSHTILKSWGIFINANYSTYGKKFMSPLFEKVSSRRNLKNLPPVCILTWNKK